MNIVSEADGFPPIIWKASRVKIMDICDKNKIKYSHQCSKQALLSALSKNKLGVGCERPGNTIRSVYYSEAKRILKNGGKNYGEI